MACDHSGSASYCMHHLQDAFDALDAIKDRYPNPLTTVGLSDGVVDAVGTLIQDTEGVAARMGLTVDDVAATLFIDGLMMGLLLAARAPKDHARHALAEVAPTDGSTPREGS